MGERTGRRDSPTALADTVGAGSNPGAPTEAARAETDPLMDTVLGDRYRITRLIGEGGMGSVYEATHVELGKRVAVKVLRPTFSNDGDFVERFRREARATSQLGHPNIVEVTDYGRTPDGRAYFVMEFLEGKDLADTLAEVTKLEVRRAARIARQICDALEVAHRAGIIHRDLKPENIFLARKNGDPEAVKLVDFGIALSKAEPRRLTRTEFLGTAEYMAPEQAGGTVDHRADIYALGVLLYEMLTGRVPHKGETLPEIFLRKARRPTSVSALQPEVPRDLDALIMYALAADPARRPQSMAEFRERLDRCTQVATGVAPPALEPRRTTETTRAITTTVGAELLRTGRRDRMGHHLGTIAIATLALALLVGAVHYLSRMTPRVLHQEGPHEVPVATKEPGTTRRDRVRPATRGARRGKQAKTPETRRGAHERVETARADTSRSAHALIALGREELEAGHFAAAAATFNAALEAGARGDALEGLAQVAFQEQRYVEAEISGRRAIAAGNHRARLIVAGSLFARARYPEAANEYERVLKDFPGNREATRNLASARARASIRP